MSSGGSKDTQTGATQQLQQQIAALGQRFDAVDLALGELRQGNVALVQRLDSVVAELRQSNQQQAQLYNAVLNLVNSQVAQSRNQADVNRQLVDGVQRITNLLERQQGGAPPQDQ